MRNIRLLRVPLFAALAISVLAVGCKDLLVYENFSMIRQNVTTQAEVERLLGAPDMKFDNGWRYDRPEKHLTAIVDFDNSGRVVRKQWIDAMGEIWEDSAEGSRQSG